MKDNKSKDVSPTIQETNPVSENNSPDTIEMLYIESPSIGLVEFRRRLEQLIKEERIAELKLMDKDTLGNSLTPENKLNKTWMGGLNFAKNNFKWYKINRIKQLTSSERTKE